MYDSTKYRYDMILGIDLSTELWLNLKLSEHVIKADDGPLKGPISPMIYLCTYQFKDLNTVKIIPEELFMNAYVEEVFESEHVRTSNKLLRTLLDDKYEKAYLNTWMKNQRQHLT